MAENQIIVSTVSDSAGGRAVKIATSSGSLPQDVYTVSDPNGGRALKVYQINGANNKSPAVVLSATNITIAAPGATIDGIALSANDRVVLNGETSGVDNGIYVYNGAAVPMTRATDADTGAEIYNATISIQQGTYADTIWILANNSEPTIGVTSLSFAQLGIAYAGTTNRITVTGTVIDIAATYVGQSSITTVGTLTSGATGAGFTVALGTSTITGILPIANGGTGVNIGTTALTLGTASANSGSVIFQNATNANTVTINSGVTSASYSLTLPTAQASGTQVLQNNGSGVLSWATASGGITVSSTTITGGTSGAIPFNSAGVYGEDATQLFWDNSNDRLGVGTSSPGRIIEAYKNADASQGIKIQNPNAGGSTYAVLEIATNGGSGYLLKNSTANTAYGGAGSFNIGTIADESVSILVENTVKMLFSNSGDNENVFLRSASTNNRLYIQTSSTGTGTTDGFLLGVTGGSDAYLWNYENAPVIFGTNNTERGSFNASGVFFVGNGETSATAASGTISGTGGSGTNNAGASITAIAGAATGTAAGGNNVEKTTVKTASGTTAQLSTDRHNIVGKYVDITGGAATTFGNLALATSSTVAGGTVIYTIEANDGTDFQALSGVLKYDVVNKAGALTVVYEDDQNGTGACSTGTLTATVDATASGTNVLFRANAVSSLTETVLRVSFQVLNNYGVATITAA